MSAYGRGRVYKWRNKWVCSYYDKANKKKSRESRDTRAEAQALLDARLGERATTGRLLGPTAEKVTLGEVFAAMEADRRLRKRRSVAPTKHLLDRYGADCKVLNLTHDVLTEYADARITAGAKEATVRNEMLALGRAWRLAFKAGKLPQPPNLPAIQVQNVRKGFFTPDEVVRVLAELPDHLRSYIEALAITGWRRSEVAGLRWQNVDWRAGELRLESGTTKNGDGRAYPFKAHPRLAEVLHEQREATSRFERESGSVCQWVFHHDGHKLNGWNYRAWRRACAAAGVPGRLMHDLRRSAARDLIRSGVPEGIAMKLCGWRTRAVLARYDIVSTTDLEAAVSRLAEYRAQNAERGVVPMAKGKRG